MDAGLEKQIATLEADAARVLELKRQSRPKRPIVIEFCGSPKAGKTQAVTSLTIFLKRNGFSVRVLTERASVSPVSDKRSPYFNVWTGCSILTGLIPYLSEQIPDVDVVIADRGVFDTLCWFTWLVDQGFMEGAEGDELSAFFSARRFRQATDLVLAFTASAEASMEREYATLLTRKLGSIMSPGVLESYVASIHRTVDRYGPAFKNVELIDTSDLAQNDVAVAVTNAVLGSIVSELEEHVAGVRRSDLERICDSRGLTPLEELSKLELSFIPRATIEDDPDWVQIVPVAVLADEAKKEVMVFRKRKETLGEMSSPERDKNLLYVGGHMREEDAFGVASGALEDMVKVALQREMSEEIGATLRVDPDVLCFWDRDGSVKSQKHLAVIHTARANFVETKLRLDGYELVQPHNSPMSGSLVPVSEAAKWPLKNVESWSRAILLHIFGITLGPAPELELGLH